jgi:hypothetical protein
MRKFEEAMLASEQQEGNSDSRAELDSKWEPVGEELLNILDGILVPKEATEKSEWVDWRRKCCSRPYTCHTWHWWSATTHPRATRLCAPTGYSRGC